MLVWPHPSFSVLTLGSEWHPCPPDYIAFDSRRGHPDPFAPHPQGLTEPQPRLVRVRVENLTARLLHLHLGPWIKHQLGRRAPCPGAWGTSNWGQLTHAWSTQTSLCCQLRGHVKRRRNSWVWSDIQHSGYCLHKIIGTEGEHFVLGNDCSC